MAGRVEQRPRSKSVLSFGSHKTEKSHRSSGSKTKISLHETSEEKHRLQIQSKADPSLAISEAQPAAVAMEKSTLASLSAGQYKDIYGNPINDPDIANPTRHRAERPLETIRSFEIAIDREYREKESPNRRSSVVEEQPNGWSRRSSTYQGYGNQQQQQQQQSTYGSRQSVARPETNYNYPYGNSYNNNSAYPQHNGAVRPSRHASRMSTDPGPYASHYQNPYASNGYQQSYDAATSGSGSGSHGTEPWGNSTDPSSENSSVDRLQQVSQSQASKPDLGEQYGFTGFGGAPQVAYFQADADNQQNYGGPVGGYPNQSQTNVATPTARGPIKPGNNGGAPAVQQVRGRPQAEEKRKSWFKRRFSKD